VLGDRGEKPVSTRTAALIMWFRAVTPCSLADTNIWERHTEGLKMETVVLLRSVAFYAQILTAAQLAASLSS
jgi:hypothetical protein